MYNYGQLNRDLALVARFIVLDKLPEAKEAYLDAKNRMVGVIQKLRRDSKAGNLGIFHSFLFDEYGWYTKIVEYDAVKEVTQNPKLIPLLQRLGLNVEQELLEWQINQ